MSGRPPGLKIYPGLLSAEEVARLLGLCRGLPAPPGNPLFRYFGAFGEGAATEPVRPWMEAWGDAMVARGLFKRRPNQYRVTNWIGELAGQFKWHIDSARHGERILAIGLTPGRAIGFRPRGRRQAPYVLRLAPGGGYLIRATARWRWEHRVMPVGRDRSGGESFVMAWKRGGDGLYSQALEPR